MLLTPNTVQLIKVPAELYGRCNRFLNKGFQGRYQDGDSDKELEIDICKYVFPDANRFCGPRDWSEERDEVDVWVNGEAVQIKCRSQIDHLILEDYKLRSDGEKTSWIDRSIANHTVIVSPAHAPYLKTVIYDTRDLKRLLEGLRVLKSFGPDVLDEEFAYWADLYFPNWKLFTYKVKEAKTNSEHAIFDILA